jgi:single-strand DNA-binding protein
MSLNYNRVTLAGNLTRDPQVRFFANEKAVADFGLAINRKFKGNDGSMKEETTFVDVEAWGRTAELVGQYLTKGSGCFVEGRLKLDSWDDKKTGEKRSKIKVVADSVQFLGGRGERGGPGAPAGDQGQSDQSDANEAPVRPAPSRPAAAPAGDDEPPF